MGLIVTKLGIAAMVLAIPAAMWWPTENAGNVGAFLFVAGVFLNFFGWGFDFRQSVDQRREERRPIDYSHAHGGVWHVHQHQGSHFHPWSDDRYVLSQDIIDHRSNA